jgi:hypothetical protein
MKIDSHTIIYKAAQSKFNVETGSIVEDNDLFTLTGDDGRVFTQADFTSTELSKAKTDIEAELAQAATAKTALLSKLGITADEAKLLLL